MGSGIFYFDLQVWIRVYEEMLYIRIIILVLEYMNLEPML